MRVAYDELWICAAKGLIINSVGVLFKHIPTDHVILRFIGTLQRMSGKKNTNLWVPLKVRRHILDVI